MRIKAAWYGCQDSVCDRGIDLDEPERTRCRARHLVGNLPYGPGYRDGDYRSDALYWEMRALALSKRLGRTVRPYGPATTW